MTHSIPAQSTHTNADNAPISFKIQAGSPKPDISQINKKSINDADVSAIETEHITEKDLKKLINTPNKFLADFYARVALYDMPNSIIEFYEQKKDLINGEVVIVRSKEDEGYAAMKRNTCDKALFIFSVDYNVTSYFSSVCQKINFPTALLMRVNHGKPW